MKLHYLALILLLSPFAQADLYPGDRVLYPTEARRTGHGAQYTVGVVKTLRNNGTAVVQQMNHPSKYGLTVNRPDANGILQKYYGESEVSEYHLLEEVPYLVSPTTHKIVKTGSPLKMKIGRNPSALCFVVYTFEGGHVAVMLPNNYWDWVKHNKREQTNQNDDSIFTVKPVGIYVGKIL